MNALWLLGRQAKLAGAKTVVGDLRWDVSTGMACCNVCSQLGVQEGPMHWLK